MHAFVPGAGLWTDIRKIWTNDLRLDFVNVAAPFVETKVLHRSAKPHGSEAGFTLLELLVVLAILGLLAAVVGPQVLRYLGSSKTQTAAVQSKNIVAALNLYKLDVGSYPTKTEGLQALMKSPPSAGFWNGPYLPDTSALVDPWRNPYQLKVPGDHGEVDVYSLGSDKAPGGSGDAKDVGNW